MGMGPFEKNIKENQFVIENRKDSKIKLSLIFPKKEKCEKWIKYLNHNFECAKKNVSQAISDPLRGYKRGQLMFFNLSNGKKSSKPHLVIVSSYFIKFYSGLTVLFFFCFFFVYF